MTALRTGSLYYLFSYTAVAFIIALLVTPLVRSLAFRLRAVDRGTGRRAHQGVIPRLGGIAIYLSIVIPLLVMIGTSPRGWFNDRLVGVILAGTLVFAVGVLDDIRGLSIRVKLSAEVLAAVVLFAWGLRITAVTNPFGGHIDLHVLSLPVTVLWIVVICNAINLIDGLDGLAAGSGILISVALFLMSTHRSAGEALVPLVVSAALLGFLRHNFPPATIFMGDSGSLFLGFFLAAAGILFSSKATAVATMMVPVLVFAHPIMDMGYAVLRRIYRGVPLGEPDRDHIHHKLLDMGLSRQLVLTVLVGMNVLFLLGTWLVVQRQRGSDIILLAVLAVVFVAGLRLFGYVKFGQVFRGDVRLLLMNRERRYVLFLVRQFRKQAAGSSTVEGLRPHVERLLAETGYVAAIVRLNQVAASGLSIVFGVDPGSGVGIRTNFPVVLAGVEVGRCDLVASEGRHSPVDAAELADAISESVTRVTAAA